MTEHGGDVDRTRSVTGRIGIVGRKRTLGGGTAGLLDGCLLVIDLVFLALLTYALWTQYEAIKDLKSQVLVLTAKAAQK